MVRVRVRERLMPDDPNNCSAAAGAAAAAAAACPAVVCTCRKLQCASLFCSISYNTSTLKTLRSPVELPPAGTRLAPVIHHCGLVTGCRHTQTIVPASATYRPAHPSSCFHYQTKLSSSFALFMSGVKTSFPFHRVTGFSISIDGCPVESSGATGWAIDLPAPRSCRSIIAASSPLYSFKSSILASAVRGISPSLLRVLRNWEPKPNPRVFLARSEAERSGHPR